MTLKLGDNSSAAVRLVGFSCTLKLCLPAIRLNIRNLCFAVIYVPGKMANNVWHDCLDERWRRLWNNVVCVDRKQLCSTLGLAAVFISCVSEYLGGGHGGRWVGNQCAVNYVSHKHRHTLLSLDFGADLKAIFSSIFVNRRAQRTRPRIGHVPYIYV